MGGLLGCFSIDFGVFWTVFEEGFVQKIGVSSGNTAYAHYFTKFISILTVFNDYVSEFYSFFQSCGL